MGLNLQSTKVLIVGLGGIGSNLVDLVIPALSKCNIITEIHLMDDDYIDYSNIGHQKFRLNDISKSKVAVLQNRYSQLKGITIVTKEEALKTSKQLTGYDIIVVCVDRPEPRKLVHNSGVNWLDLRCQGDGWILIDHNTESDLLTKLPENKQPTSCQIPGAIEQGNIEFGFAAVAAIGAQWLFQQIRMTNGHSTQLPKFRMGYLTHGQVFLQEGGTINV